MVNQIHKSGKPIARNDIIVGLHIAFESVKWRDLSSVQNLFLAGMALTRPVSVATSQQVEPCMMLFFPGINFNSD